MTDEQDQFLGEYTQRCTQKAFEDAAADHDISTPFQFDPDLDIDMEAIQKCAEDQFAQDLRSKKIARVTAPSFALLALFAMIADRRSQKRLEREFEKDSGPENGMEP